MPNWSQESTELGPQSDQDGGSKSSQLGAGGHLGSKVECGPMFKKKKCIVRICHKLSRDKNGQKTVKKSEDLIF